MSRSSGLKVARNVTLPIDFVTQTCAILAQRRKGKTYTGSVLAEELVAARLPFVALDPTGAWWGLRSSADGESAGLPVVVIGGQHGDLPLERSSGEAVADLVVDHPGYYVIDLSLLESRAAEREFSLAFATRLHRRKMQPGMDFPLHLFVDEADLFVPQEKDEKGDTKVLGAFQGIVRRGGLHGLGTTLISQRPALVNKNVLTQIDVLILLRLVAGYDQEAVWKNYVRRFGEKEQQTEIMDSLASLPVGEAWILEPGADPPRFVRTRIRERRTFNSSATPKPGERRVEPRVLADVDLEDLRSRMAATIERAKADDPRELRRVIAELRRELSSRPTETREVPVERIVEIPVLSTTDLARIDSLIENYADVAGSVSRAAADIDERYGDLIGKLGEVRGKTQVAGEAAAAREQDERGGGRTIGAGRPSPRPAPAPTTSAGALAQLGTGGAPRAILTVLAQWPAGRTQSQISILSGYSRRSSTFQNGLSTLRKQGLISPAGTDPIRITEQGLAEAGPVDEPPTGEALFAYWRQKLGQGAPGAFLEALYRAYPNELSHDELAEQSGYSARSSTFQNGLSKLRKLDLAEGYGGSIRATPDLFEEVFA